MHLYVQEEYIDAEKEVIIGKSDVYKSRYTKNQIRKLFNNLQRNYGLCLGSVYVDGKERNQANRVGWIFRKKQDDGLTQDTWVTLHKQPPERIVNYDYFELR